MLIKSRLLIAVWVAGLVGMLALACTGSDPAALPDAAPDDTGASSANVSVYDSNSQMYKVFPGFGLTSADTFTALDEVRDQGDKSMVPVLVESMRFQSSERARNATVETLSSLTGLTFSGSPWLEWSNWLAENHEAYPPPSDYLDWKIDFMSQIDPRFALFLRPAKQGQINVNPTELTWGGVRPDGIPDIRDPKMIPAQEADYLGFDDRVFGLSINGDTRAYPLRIVNAHEMVNDTVGGEPISLSW